MASVRAAVLIGGFLTASCLFAQYVGSQACRPCHAARVELQATTGHAHALARATAGSPGQWAFGAGAKATTWVSQVDPDTYVEHGLSYFAASRSMGLTPGHDAPQDVRYRTFDPAATTLRCFRCHSTGPLTLDNDRSIQPAEPGVRCETCHGPGEAHVASQGRGGTIFNPKHLRAVDLNNFCGACHRTLPESDWTDKWKTRHQPSYLAQAPCFRNSQGALTCLTCHDPHAPLNRTAAQYDQRCVECHKAVRHSTPVARGRTCIECHMPQVPITAQLKFTNHWIGIYTRAGGNLVPSGSSAKSISPLPPADPAPFTPADPASLRPLYERALAELEKKLGTDDPKVARSALDLGTFVANTGDKSAAEGPLRKALAIDQRNRAPQSAEDAEQVAMILAETGRTDEAAHLFQEAAAGPDPRIAARSLANLALLDPAQAEQYYRAALTAERRAEGNNSRRVAILLDNLAAILEQKKNYPAAVDLFRQALAIQKNIQPDDPAAASTMSNLGSLLETMGQHAEAERLEREAVRIFELRLGPWSAELATSCTNLADILWTKGDRNSAGNLYRRAISIDESVYGPDNQEVAGDLVNYGTLLKESGQAAAADQLLRHALAIYEKAGDTAHTQAMQVRQLLASPGP
jgi:tetratricopeptide (TPR) repeat protein